MGCDGDVRLDYVYPGPSLTSAQGKHCSSRDGAESIARRGSAGIMTCFVSSRVSSVYTLVVHGWGNVDVVLCIPRRRYDLRGCRWSCQARRTEDMRRFVDARIQGLRSYQCHWAKCFRLAA
jgi:hypothetical protein